VRSLPPPDDIQNIAVRLTNWVGDCVMNTPFLGRLRAIFPSARIVVFGRKNVTGLFQQHPHVDDVRMIDDKSLGGFRRAAADLRNLDADLGFLLPNSLKAALLFKAGGVRRRVGYDRDYRRLLLSHPVALRPDDLAVHEVRYYLRLLHFWETGPVDPPPLCLAVGEEERSGMGDWLEGEGIEPNQLVVGVNPAAFYGTAKRWLPRRYAEVAARLRDRHGAAVVVTGLPSEHDVAEEVCRAGGKGFVNAAGRMTLRQLMAFLAQCDLYLTNDSGAMHVAAALGTPVAAVFGSTDWVTTAPLGQHTRIIRVETPCAPCLLRHCPIDHRCMTGVTSEMVWEQAEDLLQQLASEKPSQGAKA